MRTTEVSVYALVRLTERVENVVLAIEKIFPGLIMEIQGDTIKAHNGLSALINFHDLLRKQRILDTARSIMLSGCVGNAIQFRLSKQAAFMGRINFPPEEEPLGSIHVQIVGDELLMDWLAPKTENGVPIEEIDLKQENWHV